MQRITLVAHLLLVAILLWMSAQVLVQAIDRAESEYVSPYFPAIVAIGLLPLGLVAFLVWGAWTWSRTGRRRALIAADAVTVAATLTVLMPLVFLADDSLLLALGLSLACLAVTAIVPQSRTASPETEPG